MSGCWNVKCVYSNNVTHVLMLQVESADGTDPNELLSAVAQAVTGITGVIPGTVTIFPAPPDLAMPVLASESLPASLPATLFDDLV